MVKPTNLEDIIKILVEEIRRINNLPPDNDEEKVSNSPPDDIVINALVQSNFKDRTARRLMKKSSVKFAQALKKRVAELEGKVDQLEQRNYGSPAAPGLRAGMMSRAASSCSKTLLGILPSVRLWSVIIGMYASFIFMYVSVLFLVYQAIQIASSLFYIVANILEAFSEGVEVPSEKVPTTVATETQAQPTTNNNKNNVWLWSSLAVGAATVFGYLIYIVMVKKPNPADNRDRSGSLAEIINLPPAPNTIVTRVAAPPAGNGQMIPSDATMRGNPIFDDVTNQTASTQTTTTLAPPAGGGTLTASTQTETNLVTATAPAGPLVPSGDADDIELFSQVLSMLGWVALMLKGVKTQPPCNGDDAPPAGGVGPPGGGEPPAGPSEISTDDPNTSFNDGDS